jgi:uncharacterized protein (TIGR02466 family)
MTATHASDAALDPIVDIAAHGGIEYLFPTPIFWHVFKQVDALNAELRELILAQERATPSTVKSNQGGWQSSTDFFHWSAPPAAALRRLAVAAVETATSRLPLPPGVRAEFHLSAWAAVNRAGHYNTVHVHPMATWSGIYYVDPGDDGAGGLLELSHPVAAATMTFFPGALPSARLVRPEPGLVILFPGYLQHSVRLYQGERPRICVPFNAHLRLVGASDGAG